MLTARTTPVQLHTRHVRRYYEENTRLLLSLGQGTEGTIRRAVWGDGVQSRTRAMAYVDELILARMKAHFGDETNQPLHVVDLGCGVCASLCRMAHALPIIGTGITLSRAQATLASARIAEAGLAERVRCLEADFASLPSNLPRADVAFAIESFVHAADPAVFFEQAAALVRPGGLLVVCDDFVAHPAVEDAPEARRWLQRFREGWVIGHLTTEEQAREFAARSGFRHSESRELTAQLELGRPRDQALALVMRCLGWLPIGGSYWSMLRGGDALQRCLRRGWLKYTFAVWERR